MEDKKWRAENGEWKRVFRKKYRIEEGEQKKNYYVGESVSIACGFLLAAIRNAGLASLTHTPSPMNFLRDILQRPSNEVPCLLIPVDHPGEHAWVPGIQRKSLDQIITQNIPASEPAAPNRKP